MNLALCPNCESDMDFIEVVEKEYHDFYEGPRFIKIFKCPKCDLVEEY